jgi:hypothetical protein
MAMRRSGRTYEARAPASGYLVQCEGLDWKAQNTSIISTALGGDGVCGVQSFSFRIILLLF